MKKIYADDFAKMLDLGEWGFEASHVIDFDDFRDADDGMGGTVEIPHLAGYATNELTLDGITISYSEAFSLDKYDFETLATHRDFNPDEAFSVTGAEIVEDLGEEGEYVLTAADLYDMVCASRQGAELTSVDYDFLRNTTEVVDID